MKRLAKLVGVALVIVALVAFARGLMTSHGRFRGALYRLFGFHPCADVDDRTLADRVRSELGPVEKRLDLPRVHVMVNDHEAVLHGDVAWPHEAATLVETARHVAGVRAVDSHLHVGLLSSDTRPSQGRRRARMLAKGAQR